MSQSLKITEAASEYFKKQLNKENRHHIRLGVKEVGCSGLAYVIDYIDAPSEDDLVFDKDGYCIYISPEHYKYLEGTEVDFVKRGINAMIEFNNPNATGSCGCGESFTVNKS